MRHKQLYIYPLLAVAVIALQVRANPVDIRILQAGNGSDFVFFSFESAVFPCVNRAGCETIFENGQVQTLGSVTWQFPNGGTVVDAIQFQSGEDAAPTSEPAPLLLLLGGSPCYRLQSLPVEKASIGWDVLIEQFAAEGQGAEREIRGCNLCTAQ